MKKLIFLSLILFFASCSVKTYYQVFKTTTENGIFTKNKIVFEDNNCSVSYNLWNEGGKINFSVYNKTEDDLTINLAKTFYVLNGVAYPYFQNRTFSQTSNSGSLVSSNWYYNIGQVTETSSSSFNTTYIEKAELTIPPKTSIHISEFSITNARYRDCNLPKYPSQKNYTSLNFDINSSPIVFYNLITYSTKNDTLRFENKFHVSEITNYPSSEMFITVDTTFCGGKIDFPYRAFIKNTPDKFYIKYNKDK